MASASVFPGETILDVEEEEEEDESGPCGPAGRIIVRIGRPPSDKRTVGCWSDSLLLCSDSDVCLEGNPFRPSSFTLDLEEADLDTGDEAGGALLGRESRKNVNY